MPWHEDYEKIGERLTALITDLAAFKKLMDERDRRYALGAEAQDKAVAAALASAKEMTTLAKAEVDMHLKSLNAIRSMADDQSRTFARSEEVKLLVSALEIRLVAINNIVQGQLARGGSFKEFFGYVTGIVGLLIAAIVAYIHNISK